MTLKVLIDFPDDFYVTTLTELERNRVIARRLQDAINMEWPLAPMDTVKVLSVEAAK